MKLIVIFLLLFFLAQPVLAVDAPVLISPSNNSTISSIPTFSWQAVSGGVGYNILIDDEPTVTSPYAKTPYYPTNPSYSPQTLNPGTYYWKVKAKDSSGNWGSFSSIWSFTLTSSYPTPTLTPSPTPTPSPTSISTSSTTQSTSSFTISNIPSQVNSDQSFNVSINLSLSDKLNTLFYLKGVFRHPDKPTNYFGLTKVGSSWIKNSISSSEQFPITTNSSGNWSGNLEIKPDANDSGFIGSGDYLFKAARYEGSNLTWSNELNIQITALENTDQGSISPDSSSSTTAPSSSPQSEQSTKSNKSKAASSQSKSYDRLILNTASVAAATTSAIPTSSIQIKNQKEPNPILWIGLGLVISGIGSLIFIYLRSKNLHEEIYHWFRRRN